MTTKNSKSTLPDLKLEKALVAESIKFKKFYLWLKENMPAPFFKDVNQENILLVIHNLMGLNFQEYFTTIHLRRAAIVILLDCPDADIKVLKDYAMYGIKNYQAYVSKSHPPISGIKSLLRIVQIRFTEAVECVEKSIPKKTHDELRALVKQRNPELSNKEFEKIIRSISARFIKSLPIDRLILALDMFFRTKTRDNCQYEVRYNDDWKEKNTGSMQIVLAWKNVPKHHFLYRLARIVHRHGLIMKKVNAAYIDPYSVNNTLLMAISLHGINEKAAWDVANIPDFLREFATVKYFASFDLINEHLIKPEFVDGKFSNFLRSMINFVHQALVYTDPNLYTVERIEEDLTRHPEITNQLCTAFEAKFDPDKRDPKTYENIRKRCLKDIENLDTGHPENDTRRKNILLQGLNLVHYTLKTNFYRLNYTAISFRLDPKYLDDLPFDRREKFPKLPYGIFFIKGMHFFGFHIRFKDLARGGLRTVYPRQYEHVVTERNEAFSECYNLALTQHLKNKDIPEGGSKGVIFLKPYSRMESEAIILKKELEDTKTSSFEIDNKLTRFRQEQEIEYLHQSQRSYIESLITIVNCDPEGKIRAKHVVDYLKKPEYIYLGPDENMHDEIIKWIANFSLRYDYKPGTAFISGKPKRGINHKEFGVTSLGVNIYMAKLLEHMGINPKKEIFTVKISGGPDGDVAGNQIRNLHKYYPKTAKLIALTDISGTIYDPKGLDLNVMIQLFNQARPIKYYPPEKLTTGGFLVDKTVKRQPTAIVQQTLCWRNKRGKLIEDWLSGSDMNHLVRNNVHQTFADVFIPCGGRPKTLNSENISDYLDELGNPTSKGIVEGANIYLTDNARRFLEKRGVLIIKDSSANKTGVICSSFEVMCGLVLDDAAFQKEKRVLLPEILEKLNIYASLEADLLLKTHRKKGGYLTDISDQISLKINQFTYEILGYLENAALTSKLISQFIDYCLPTLVKKYRDPLLREIPDHHKKAIIACHLATKLVYDKGLDWKPSIVDILPVLTN